MYVDGRPPSPVGLTSLLCLKCGPGRGYVVINCGMELVDVHCSCIIRMERLATHAACGVVINAYANDHFIIIRKTKKWRQGGGTRCCIHDIIG